MAKEFHTKDLPGMPARKPRSTARFSFDKAHTKMVPKVQVGGKHSFTVTGNVTGAHSADDYSGPSVEMDLHGVQAPVEPDADDMPGTLTKALRARHSNRHATSGKFVP